MNQAISTTATHPGQAAYAPGRLRAMLDIVGPFWRYGVYFSTLFAVVAFGTVVRLDAQAARKDLDRVGRATQEATVLRDRLRLEVAARHRAMALEPRATAAGLGLRAKVVDLRVTTP